MNRRFSVALATLAVAAGIGTLAWSSKYNAAVGKDIVLGYSLESDELAAARALTAEFVKSATARDAKAMAAMWTEHGEAISPDGDRVHGRAAIEKMYADMFKDSPKLKLEVTIESAHRLGKTMATAEGVTRIVNGDGTPELTRFTAMLANEDGKWRLASVQEWPTNANDFVALKDLEWLIGEWAGKNGDTEVKTSYAWGEGKAYIQCRFTVTDKGTVVASGTEILAKDPASGGLRGWLFDRSGTVSQADWSREAKQWTIDVAGTLPDGSEMTAINSLTPNGADSFTWQSMERTVGNQKQPSGPPMKVTRVKK